MNPELYKALRELVLQATGCVIRIDDRDKNAGSDQPATPDEVERQTYYEADEHRRLATTARDLAALANWQDVATEQERIAEQHRTTARELYDQRMQGDSA
ncbi:hypothetical protein LCD36_04875 [Saccharopolyspora sp. 6T]|uniref:hypothetical protein n=1 Tax=Saccharopolyspora sp. 6T TaxID=2877238 RepID=UPI001CD56072|nr:hypothetical protein [Saccharopolyspora sp. 6T]MCA1185786.1 hypothetical protein [Saccharopolyspora sp. 6T]